MTAPGVPASGRASPGRVVSGLASSVPSRASSHMPMPLAETIARMKKVKSDPAKHLRRSPLQMGMPPQMTTSYMASSLQVSEKANDPKWSSDLKRLDEEL